MASIVEIRRYREQGLSKKATAKRTGLHRDTVAKHWDGPVDAEAPRYTRRAHKVDPYQDYITERLQAYPELSAKRLYGEIRDKGYSGSYRSVRRWVAAVRPKHQREYAPVKTIPGEQAQVDWGHVGEVMLEGRRYKLYAFVFTLAWSRWMYCEFVVSLNTATFLASLNRALQALGGVPRTILFDNAKTVVSERVGTVVRFNEHLLRFALEAGFTPEACWARDPESKGKVESCVKYVQKGFFYGLEWSDLADLAAGKDRWLAEVANQRVHGTTHCVPAQRLEEERPYLKELPAGLPTYVVERRRTTKDRLISIDGNRYFVETAKPKALLSYRRYEDHIEVDGATPAPVRIPLVYGYREPPALERRPAVRPPSHPLQAAFEALAPDAPAYLQGLSRSGKGHLREQMERIAALGDSHTPDAMEAAFRRAVEYRAFGYSSFCNILRHLSYQGRKEQPAQAARALPRIVLEERDLGTYAQPDGVSR